MSTRRRQQQHAASTTITHQIVPREEFTLVISESTILKENMVGHVSFLRKLSRHVIDQQDADGLRTLLRVSIGNKSRTEYPQKRPQ
jgi:hypothetical protein